MNKFIKIAAIVGLAALLVILYRAKQTSDNTEISDDVLIVGTNAEFPPFSLIEENSVVGFDIDIAKEVAKRLGKKIVIKDMPFETLLIEMQRGSIQLIAAGMTPAEGRNVLFTKPYVEGDPLLAITLKKNPPINSLDELRDKSITVNDGFTADMYMSGLGWADLRRFKTVADSFLALRNGQVDAFVTAQNPAKPFLDHYGRENFNIFIIPNQNDTTALAVAKNNPQLLQKVDSILDEMKEDGTIDSLKKKWNIS